MNEAIKMLIEEKLRLESLCQYCRNKFDEITKSAITIKDVVETDGKGQKVKYLIKDNFTPEQNEIYENICKKMREHNARLCVFDNYIKSMIPQEVIDSYDNYVEPITKYKDVRIQCNNVEIRDYELVNPSIKVGYYNVPSQFEMSIEDYNQLYTESMTRYISLLLGNNLTTSELQQGISNVCEEIYLNPSYLNSKCKTRKKEEI